MGSRRQNGAGEMTKFQFLGALFLLSYVQARLVRRETSSLIEAAQQGNLDRVRRLVNDAHAPDVNELGPNDRTPLIFAASFGDPAIVQELVQAGALLDFQDSFGWSPLHWAAYRGHMEVVQELVGGGVDINITTKMDRNTKKQYTAWDLASMYGHSEVADFLRSQPFFP